MTCTFPRKEVRIKRGMVQFFFSGFETPLAASVFSAAAAALFLGLTPDECHVFRLDRLWTR
ncbi:hypothetical protein [Mycolicibacterium mucogenicum]|uniref:hypothetical protein n=1 Tax=Mycolicibacterium mucogenicum TaxID=56689 RepID=UPI000769E9EB|nr:hypothetical protein [Mycolicibacterium mucogenicum]